MYRVVDQFEVMAESTMNILCLRWRFVTVMVLLMATRTIAQPPMPAYEVKLDIPLRGYDGKMSWVHPRAGLIPGRPGEPPNVIMTLMKARMDRSDVFSPVWDFRTDDLGKTWSKPQQRIETFARRAEGRNGIEVGVCDFTPQWHAASGKLLNTGHTVKYRDDTVIAERSRQTAYSAYDAEAKSWSPWKTIVMPDEPRFYNCGAGCTQRVDLDDGSILLPFYFRPKESKDYRAAVMKCQFDGSELKYESIGNEVTLEGGRGLYEPSLSRFRGKYYLTLRNDTAGYVATSDDGMHFGQPTRWNWDDDGTDVGTYNTQQHWVTHSGGLFLVYTRKGANNDHVFRHRAPLFMAAVDIEKLRVIRATEREILPEKGARYGNFGVVNVSEHETWITEAEWMQVPKTPNSPQRGGSIAMPIENKWGADAKVYVARILWKTPNELFAAPKAK
jgi:hypothetical protein